MREKIIILPCNGDCAAGQITMIAAQELVLEGKAEWYSLHSQTAADTGAELPQSFIIIDGCEKQCLFTACLEQGIVGKHYLALPDVGIEPLYFQDITREDIELAKDAVIAECTEIDKMPPPLFSGCCCG